jgi:hypothetical protein
VSVSLFGSQGNGRNFRKTPSLSSVKIGRRRSGNPGCRYPSDRRSCPQKACAGHFSDAVACSFDSSRRCDHMEHRLAQGILDSDNKDISDVDTVTQIYPDLGHWPQTQPTMALKYFAAFKATGMVWCCQNTPKGGQVQGFLRYRITKHTCA